MQSNVMRRVIHVEKCNPGSIGRKRETAVNAVSDFTRGAPKGRDRKQLHSGGPLRSHFCEINEIAVGCEHGQAQGSRRSGLRYLFSAGGRCLANPETLSGGI